MLPGAARERVAGIGIAADSSGAGAAERERQKPRRCGERTTGNSRVCARGAVTSRRGTRESQAPVQGIGIGLRGCRECTSYVASPGG